MTLAFTKKQADKTSGKSKRKSQDGRAEGTKTAANKDRIVTYTRTRSGTGTAEVAAHIQLSAARTRALLAELVAEGQIVPEGNGRARRYYAAEKA